MWLKRQRTCHPTRDSVVGTFEKAAHSASAIGQASSKTKRLEQGLIIYPLQLFCY